ncbi:MAG: hypothetical protein AB7P20_21265 [Rhizobiaceae bacterium]
MTEIVILIEDFSFFLFRARRPFLNRLHILVLLFVCCAIAFPARGANITWSGATNSNWTLGSNWLGGAVPGGVDNLWRGSARCWCRSEFG